MHPIIKQYNEKYKSYKETTKAIETQIKELQEKADLLRKNKPKWLDIVNEIGKQLESVCDFKFVPIHASFGLRHEVQLKLMNSDEKICRLLTIFIEKQNGEYQCYYDIPDSRNNADAYGFFVQIALLPNTPEEILNVMEILL